MRTLFSAACGTKSSEFSETLRSADSVPLWLDWSVSGLVRVAVHVKRKSYMKSYEVMDFTAVSEIPSFARTREIVRSASSSNKIGTVKSEAKSPRVIHQYP